MNVPAIAIIGRPNVGKSALFNALLRERVAIVDEAEGVTRDRIIRVTDRFGKPLRLIDTGGINMHGAGEYDGLIAEQALLGIEEADGVILVVDGLAGATDLDLEIARLLHKKGKPTVVAVNKIDHPKQELLVHNFHALGLPTLLPVSSLHRNNLAELIEAAQELLPDHPPPREETASIKVAIVGRPNVGKSSLLNRILGEGRSMVSEEAGTTRDAISEQKVVEGTTFTFIDTAGIRKKAKESHVVEKFAAIRTSSAIEQADVCLLLVDATEGVTAYEKRIARGIAKAKKGCILVLNKWDLLHGVRMEHYLRALKEQMPFLEYAPTLPLSAKTGRNIEKLYPLICEVVENSRRRITTHQLNAFCEKAMQLSHPPALAGRRLRVYYLTQASANPIEIVLFVNDPALMTKSYMRYLYNQFRKKWGLQGAPVSFVLRGKDKKEKSSTTIYS